MIILIIIMIIGKKKPSVNACNPPNMICLALILKAELLQYPERKDHCSAATFILFPDHYWYPTTQTMLPCVTVAASVSYCFITHVVVPGKNCVRECVCVFHMLQRVVTLPLSQGASTGTSSPFMADILSMGFRAIYKPPVCHSGPETRAGCLVEEVEEVVEGMEEVEVLEGMEEVKEEEEEVSPVSSVSHSTSQNVKKRLRRFFFFEAHSYISPFPVQKCIVM